MRWVLRSIVVALMLLAGTASGGAVGSQIGTGFEPERNLKIGAGLGAIAGGILGTWLARLTGRPPTLTPGPTR